MWVWQTERETECLQGQEWVWRESTQLLDGGSEVSSLQSKAAAARLWHAPWLCSLTGYDKRPSGSQEQTAPCPCVRTEENESAGIIPECPRPPVANAAPLREDTHTVKVNGKLWPLSAHRCVSVIIVIHISLPHCAWLPSTGSGGLLAS